MIKQKRMTDEEKRTELLKLIDYFTKHGVCAIKSGTKIYNLTVEDLGKPQKNIRYIKPQSLYVVKTIATHRAFNNSREAEEYAIGLKRLGVGCSKNY